MKTILFLVLCMAVLRADVPSDLVTDLNEQTGYTKPWYSGYLDVSNSKNQMQSHYFFFPSQNDPSSDPVLLWLNGGPGCSSLLGASQENGPWVFETDSTDIKLNPFSWNNNANVLYIESPPGVGFSTTQDYTWDDETTAAVNLQSLLAFFKSYEEYAKLEFYISGESYAGIYVPTLAAEILKHNKQVEKKNQINLKGIMVGNGCTDPLECNLSTAVDPFGWAIFSSQGFFTPQQQEAYEKNCGSTTEPEASKLNSIECFATAQGQLSIASPGVNIYNLIGTCYYQDIPSQGQNTWTKEIQDKYYNLIRNNPQIAELSGLNEVEIMKMIEDRAVNGDLPPCTDGIGPMTFFNEDSVKKALHVDTSIRWAMCSDRVTYNYTRSKSGTYDLYPSLIEAGLRVWIYSGDTDGAVPTAGTLYWVEKLVNQENYETTDSWRAWYTDGVQYGPQPGNRQNAGQFWQTEGITLVTFKGCGHMVPQDNNVGGYDLVTAFLNGEVLPPY